MAICDGMELMNIEYECEPEDNKQLRRRIREQIYCCSSSTLNHWPVLALQSEEFLSSIRMAYVYGAKANSVLVVTEDYKVYAIGQNSFGRIGTQGDPNFLPRIVSGLIYTIVKTFISYKNGHVLALASDGALYYGCTEFKRINSASYVQLNEATFQTHTSPFGGSGMCPQNNAVSGNKKSNSQPSHNITMVACTNADFYTVSKDGIMQRWTDSSTEWGTFPNVPVANKLTTSYDTSKIIQIAATHTTCITLCETGEVYWHQRDMHALIKYPEHIEKIACGYNTVLALSDMGHVYQFHDSDINSVSTAAKLVELEHASDIAANNLCHLYTATLLNRKIVMWGTCDSVNVTVPISSPFATVEETFAKFAEPRITPGPLIIKKPKRAELKLPNCLVQEFDNPETSDFIIKVEEKCIYVHKLVLSMRSDYFKTMLNSDWKETKNGIMDHEEFSYDVYKMYLKYLYTDTLDISTQIAMDMVPVAEFYNDDHLKNRCIEILSNGMTVSDAMIIYDWALRYKIKELQDVCVNFALHNMSNVVQSPAFAQLQPKVIINLLTTFAKAGYFKT